MFFLLTERSKIVRKTPRAIKVVRFSSSSYFHFGVKEPLCNLLRSVNSQVRTVQLLVNVDGFPLSDSSNSECWPILAVVRNVRELAQRPFIIGLYHGKVKPRDSNEFLLRFIDAMQKLMDSELAFDSSEINVNKCSFRRFAHYGFDHERKRTRSFRMLPQMYHSWEASLDVFRIRKKR